MPLLPAIGFLALAQFFDYVSFLLMTARHGLAAEINPLVVLMAQNVGLSGLTVAKAAAVVIAAATIVIVGRRHRRAAAGVLFLGSVAGLVGGISNVATYSLGF